MKFIKTKTYISVILLILLFISVLVSVTIGAVDISIKDVYSVILYKMFYIDKFKMYGEGSIHDVVWLIRLPRIILAIAVGSGLSLCGVVIQAIVKNPLADPYILGISSGASLGAALAIFFSIGVSFGANYVGVIAFLGAFIVSIIVVTIANIGSRANAIKLLLAGLAISSACSSITSLLVFLANDKEGIQNLTFWLMGSLSGAKWSSDILLFFIVASGIIFFITQYRTLNIMLLGDEISVTLGTDLHKYRLLYLLITSIIIGFVVYSSGTIGFIGLIVPHFVRMFFGTDHKKVIPIASLSAAIFLLWADVIARTLIPKTELPIGMLVSIIGSPCFIYLLIKRSYGFGAEQ